MKHIFECLLLLLGYARGSIMMGKTYPRLNIVTITDGPFSGSGIEPIQSTFRVAIDSMRTKYPTLYHDYTETHLAIVDQSTACRPEGNVIVLDFLQNWYGSGAFDQDGLTVILTSLCGPAYVLVGDFAREMDLLTVSCGSVEIDEQRYPNAVALTSGSVKTYGEAYATAMNYFEWKSVAVIRDRLSLSNVGARNNEICRGPLEVMQKQAVEFNFLVVETDSSLPQGPSFTKALQDASQHSRVILCCTQYKGMRQLLADAHDLNMTSGDFVFIYLYEFQVPGEHPLSWQNGDALDKKVYYAIQSVLSIRSAVVDWNKYDATAEAVNARRKKIFGTQPDPENKRNEFAMMCYEATEVLSYGLDSALSVEGTLSSDPEGDMHIAKSQFTKGMFGKTLPLSFRNVTFLNSGLRRPEIVVQQYDSIIDDFVDIFDYDSVVKKLTLLPGRSVAWITDIKPVDRPVCGMRGELCGTRWKISSTIAIVVGAVVLIAICLACYRIRRFRNLPKWWEIKETGPSINEGFSVLPVKSTYLSELSDNQDAAIKLAQRVFLVNGVRSFRKPLYWDPKWQPTAGKRLDQYMYQIKKLDHENLNRFVGLSIEARPPIIYFQFCSKKSVENLMENATVDYTLKLSLIQNLISGIAYLHLSPVKLHGNMQSSKCLVDHYFTLKISDYGQEKLSVLLRKKQLRHLRKDLTIKRPFFPVNAWMAPEVLRGQPPNHASDVYAVGLVAHQIVMECTVFGIDCYGTRWGSIFDVKASSLDDVIHKVRNGETPPFRPIFPEEFRDGNWKLLMDLIVGCWTEDPLSRPSTSDLNKELRKICSAFDGFSGPLVDRLLRRLENYSTALERKVADKVYQLLQEQERCDELLKEMLPSEVVHQLRHGLAVVPQMVEQVTVLFCDIVGFSNFVMSFAPEKVFRFLDSVYIVFDRVVTARSVYKMETSSSYYIVVGGLTQTIGIHHTKEVCITALNLRSAFVEKCALGSLEFSAGIHTGPVAVGVVGAKRPQYCLFGDTVNVASRMQASCLPSRIHVSSKSAEIAREFGCDFELRGTIEIKGKGAMTTYWLMDKNTLQKSASDKTIL